MYYKIFFIWLILNCLQPKIYTHLLTSNASFRYKSSNQTNQVNQISQTFQVNKSLVASRLQTDLQNSEFLYNDDYVYDVEYHKHNEKNLNYIQQQKLILQNCKFDLTNQTGILYSPMFLDKLPSGAGVNCVWHIHSPNNSYAIELNIQVANFRPKMHDLAKNCIDQVIINYQQHNSISNPKFRNVILNANSNVYPKKIISARGEMIVNLTVCPSYSKRFVQKPEYQLITQPITVFYANYHFVNCSGCGVGDSNCSEIHQCDSQCGYILSINYPFNYNNNHRCKWLIIAPAQHYINVTVHEFDVPSENTVSKQKHLDCMFDHVSFIDPSKSNLIGRYCNSNKPPKFILSAWNQLIIEFNSDSNFTGRGFFLSYKVQKFHLISEINEHLIAPSTTACPANWSYYKNHCYQAFFGEQIIQWYDAEAQCAEYGAGRNGHLVSILDSNEMSAVFHFLLNVWKSPAYKAFYIGLVDNYKEGLYRWSDSRPMAYTDWAPAQLELDEDEINAPQPDGGAFEDCTIIRFDFGHSTANWHDIPCSLGSHTHVVKTSGIWSNNSDLINSFICKLDAITGIIEPKPSKIPMYKHFKTLDKQTVLKNVSRQRNFVCSNLEVISFLQKCDGVAQCSDNSDEHQCPNKKFILHRHRMEMQQSQLQALNFEINNIPKFTNSRPSLWSLASFSLPHESIQFIAQNTKSNQACLPEQYRCDNGRCVSISTYCDYADDCGDNSDEKYCSNANLVYNERNFLSKKYKNSNLTVESNSRKKNGTTQSSSKTKFSNMSFLGKNGCVLNEFRCNNGECIPAEKRCDLLIDCKDESDEGSVCSSGNHCNKNFTFQCYYGNCIPLYAVCDRHRDCPGKFHEDEQKQICQQRLLTSTQLGNRNNVNTNYANQYIEEQSTEVLLNHLMFDRLTACRQSKKRTCLDLFLYHNVNTSGNYQVKPENSHFSFETFCRFPKHKKNNSIIMQNIRTVVHHDSEIEILVRAGRTLVQPILPRNKKNQQYSNSENYGKTIFHRRKITYKVGIKSIKALISDSKQCKQLIHWRCKKGTPVKNNYSPNKLFLSSISLNPKVIRQTSHWISSENKEMPFDQCLYSNSNGLCMCEENTTSINFILKDKRHLPVMEVVFISPEMPNNNPNIMNFTNKNKFILVGYYLIGPLECQGDSDDIQTDFEDDCKDISNIELFQCQSGQIIKAKQRCIYDHDQYGYQIGCRDVTHLRNCENHVCGEDYVKCPYSYCIPPRYICDGKKDCIDGEDEQKCEEFECPGRYRCIESTYCIYLNQLCDGIRQCHKGDDEWFCDLQCPNGCTCIGLYANCNNRNLTTLPDFLSLRLRKLDLTGNNLGPRLQYLDLTSFTRLGELILKKNKIEIVPSEKFIYLINLYLLDLSYNNIKVLESRAFAGLQNVKFLHLNNNPSLSLIESHAFSGLIKLKHLNISESSIFRLGPSAFAGLISLQTLIFQTNRLKIIDSGAFNDLTELNYLNLRGNTIQTFKQDIFEKLTELKVLHTDSFKFCCLVQHQLSFDNCLPLSDEISDCEDLMSSPLQRSFLWILGIIAFIFNLVVIFWRFKKRTYFNAVSSNLLLSLGCADFLMGIYLLIIAIVDQYYRGRYIEVSEFWRKSILCKFCGFLSTMSSEASVFTLVAITADRMICIVFPFSSWKFSVNRTRKIISAIWILTFFFSVLPFFYTSYFRDEFYSRSGVCLALHITNRKPSGWEYAVVLFLVTNLLAFIFIVCCYGYMYKTVKKSSRKLTRMMSKEVQERQVGKQMAIIVLTDFCCWCPIILLGLLAIFDVTIPASIYSWIAVFILPVNSAVNPIIYTLVHFKPNLFRHRHSINNKAFYLLKPTGSIQACKTHNVPNKQTSLKAPPGYLSLLEFVKEHRDLKINDLLNICYLLNEQIKHIHANGYAIGKINFHTVFVTNKLNENKIEVYLPDFYSYRVPNSPYCDDFATDMEDFGLLVKKLLQIYHSRLKFNPSYEDTTAQVRSKTQIISKPNNDSIKSISSESGSTNNLSENEEKFIHQNLCDKPNI